MGTMIPMNTHQEEEIRNVLEDMKEARADGWAAAQMLLSLQGRPETKSRGARRSLANSQLDTAFARLVDHITELELELFNDTPF